MIRGLLPPVRHARTLLIAAVVLLLNLASTTLFVRFDLTRGRIHSLSPTSRRAVAELREPLTVRAFFSRNMPAPYNSIEQEVRDLLEEYALSDRGFFSYSFYAVGDEDPGEGEGEKLARSYGIFPIQIQKVERDEVNLVSATMGLAFLHGDQVEIIPSVTTTDRLELRITEVITQLSSRISRLIALESDIQVRLYLSSSLVAVGRELSVVPEQVRDVVDGLNRRYRDRLTLVHLDPSQSGEAAVEAARYQLAPVRLRRQDQEAYAGVAVVLGDQAYGANLLARDLLGYRLLDRAALETTIEDMAKAVLGIHEQVGYLADFGTPPYRGAPSAGSSVQTDLSRFYGLLSQDYRIEGELLAEGQIPESLKSFMVVSPRERLSDWALFQIDQFLMRGGSLLVFLDSFDVLVDRGPSGGAYGRPVYIPRETGLEPLLEHYGVRVRPVTVMDEKSFVQRERDPRGGVRETPIYFAPVIQEQGLNRDVPFVRNLDGLVVVSSSPVEPVEATDHVRIVLSSSPRSWEIDAEAISAGGLMMARPPAAEQTRSISLACLAEGPFSSYFAGKPRPQRPGAPPAQGRSAADAAVPTLPGDAVSVDLPFLEQGKGRLFVMGTSSVLGSNVLDAQGTNPNALFVLNLIDAMNGREDRAVMRAKGERFARLRESPEALRAFVKTFNIAGLPLLVVLAGVAVWMLWNARARRIQARFASEASEEQP